MYLKALEIQGFKSFPDRTRLTFEKEITAIVGPNGSGKSNISDAILWVMGEQRSKALRGGKMEDVIFGGTEKRSPMGFAQVTLVLDNSAGLFNIDAPEVSISRRYYRNGESEYYINRETVRLRDITELLMDTGLGRDGYSVIGQGRIAEIVSAKSTDRREIFEEAAGIARYRRRKEEAERKLERTEDNLLRINDKIDELEMQVAPLEKQAETARKYLILRDEQRGLEISVWMETLDRIHAQAESISADYENAKAGLDKAQAELARLYADNDNYSEKMRECDLRAESIRATISAQESLAAECDSAAAVIKAGIEHNEENIARIKAEIDEQSGRAENIDARIAQLKQRVEDIEGERSELEGHIDELSLENERNAALTGEAQQQLSRLISQENAANDSITQTQTMLSMLSDRAAELEMRRNTIDDDIAAAEDKYDDTGKQLRESEKKLSQAKEKLDEIANIINGHRMLMSGREERVSQLSAKLNKLTVERGACESRINMLSELEKDFEGLGKAVKTVMRESGRGRLAGVYGPVAGLVSVDERYALAIETALGAAMQNIVVDTQDTGKAAIEMLKRSDGGRATFLPLSGIKPNSLRRVPVGEEGFLGVASELVNYDKKFENIFLNLLGRTVVAETLGDAVRMSGKFDNQLRIVSLDGQLINAGGSMTGGSAARNTGILSRANELKKLKEQLVKLSAACEQCRQQSDDAQRELTGAKYEMEVASQQQSGAAEDYHRCESEVQQYKLLRTAADEQIENLENEKQSLSSRIKESRERMSSLKQEEEKLYSELAKIKAEISAASVGREDFERRRQELADKLSEFRQQLASLAAEKDATERSAAQLLDVRRAISGDSEQRQRSIEEIQQRSAALVLEFEEKQQQLQACRGLIAEHKSSLAAQNELRLELEGKRGRSEKAAQSKNSELLDMQSVCARFEQKKAAAEMEENQIVDKLWESYELSRSAAQQQRQPVENMAQAQKRVTELKREISRLGPVNVGAIDEYERVSQRYNFLSEQRDDVDKSKRELEKIINEITGEMKEIFSSQFKAIDESFRKVFLDLFGGGKASLELEDEENVLDCGIEIKVQPPGKAVTTISLLSGGEKSFVAIALYFAIMRVRPTPFCIMDEIDAALDEANVNRYAEYMRLMAENTQFIAITHHRGTMEEADMLYGVTMQEKGVSTVISIDLEEAERSIS